MEAEVWHFQLSVEGGLFYNTFQVTKHKYDAKWKERIDPLLLGIKEDYSNVIMVMVNKS